MIYDGALYDAMHGETLHDLDFYLEEARQAAGPVLELACGTGRVTIPVFQAGANTTGLDLDASMLAQARRKEPRIRWVQGDYRDIPIPEKFALIYCPFNALQHMLDFREFERVLRSVRAHLADRGRFIFDMFNPSIAMLNRDPAKVRPMRDLHLEGRTLTWLESSAYDDALQIVRTTWTIDGQEQLLKLRCYYPQELDALLHYNGFRIHEKFGDFNRSAFVSGAPKQVVIAG